MMSSLTMIFSSQSLGMLTSLIAESMTFSAADFPMSLGRMSSTTCSVFLHFILRKHSCWPAVYRGRKSAPRPHQNSRQRLKFMQLVRNVSRYKSWLCKGIKELRQLQPLLRDQEVEPLTEETCPLTSPTGLKTKANHVFKACLN